MISRVSRLLAVPLLLILPACALGAVGVLNIGGNISDDRSAALPPAALGAEAHGSPGASGTAATLHLGNGDYLAGELLDCGEAGNLRWQSSAFAAPLDFPLGAVSGVSFAARGPRPRPQGPFCLELEGGDALFGTLVGLSNQQAQFDAPGFGMLHVQRSAIRRVLRCREGADLIYLGPNGLLEWKESPAGAWEQDAGRLFTARNGASLVGELGLPKQACLDFELSWTSQPDFTLAFGTNAGAPKKDPAQGANIRLRVRGVGGNAAPAEQDPVFRLEVWDRELVLLGETPQKADLVSLQKIAPGAGRCHFRIYLDQVHLRAIVLGTDGGQLADLPIANAPSGPGSLSSALVQALAGAATTDAPPPPGTCLRLVNHHGNVRLEQLSIAHWNGQPPHASKGGQSRLHRSDGTVVNGEIESFDAATKEFIIAEGNRQPGVPGKTARVAADAVESIVLPSSGPGAPGSGAPGTPSRGLRALCENGVRLSGNLRKVENGRLWLNRPGIVEPVGIDLSALRSLVVLEDRKPIPEPNALLESEGLKLHGCLEERSQSPAASCLAWRPYGSLAASPLKQEFSGQIIYRDASPPRPSPPSNRVANGQVAFVGAVGAAPVAVQAGVFVMGGVININGRDVTRTGLAPPTSWKGPAMYLRTGDTIPCKVDRIDERGVTFHSPQFDATFVPHDKVKAVELENRSLATKIDLSKRDRLLTLPRSQKEDPPTHLIRSTEGDYLRGRLMEMDDKSLTVEVRMDTRRLPRDHVASIIWLDKIAKQPPAKDKPATGEAKPEKVTRSVSAAKTEQDKPETAPKPPVAAKSLPAMQVQALRSDGNRLTFRPEKLTGTTLQGTSDVLGACHVELAQVDILLIGQAIEQEAKALPYQRWNLQPAIEPKFAQADAKPGIESDLVGRPAPDFELETLDGHKFHLSEQRKKIVVLDFFATWCGPCMQTLPQLVPAMAKYRDRNVVLLGVNLQETPEEIKAMLSRLELKMGVGLDHNGAVAEKYAAVAIPQTVIIDGEGKIARLFVGGGPQYVERLCEALEAVLKPAAEQGKSQ